MNTVNYQKAMRVFLKGIWKATEGFDGDYPPRECGWALQKAHAWAEKALTSDPDRAYASRAASRALAYFADGMNLPVEIKVMR